MADLVMKKDDTYPPLKATLKQVNQETGAEEAIDLKTAIKVTCLIKPPTGATIEIVCTGPAGGAITTATGANAGKVEAYWLQGTLSQKGTYSIEFEIEWPEDEVGHTGTKVKHFQTVPNTGYRSLEVVEELGTS